jgi:hypothetical protein
MTFTALRQAAHVLFDGTAPTLWPTLNLAKDSSASFLASLDSLPSELRTLAQLHVFTSAINESTDEITEAIGVAADGFAGAVRESAATVSGTIEGFGVVIGGTLSVGAAVYAAYGK